MNFYLNPKTNINWPTLKSFICEQLTFVFQAAKTFKLKKIGNGNKVASPIPIPSAPAQTGNI